MADSNLVSVIVPVYNVKSYLQECFDSICRQSYRNIEIILVDDGSTDGSGELCDVLAANDDRTAVLHKENGGLSDARNAGLRIAQGDWISFIDSDDYVSPIFIEVLLNAVLQTGCGMSVIPFGKPFNDGASCELVDNPDLIPSAETMDSYDAQRRMLYQSLDTGAQWRLYSAGSLGPDPFPVGLYYEDLASVYKTIHKLDKVAVVDCRGLYAYRMRGDSIIRQDYKHLKGESALLIADELFSNVSIWYPDLVDAAASRCFSVCRMVFAQAIASENTSEYAINDSKKLWAVLRKHSKVVVLDTSARKRERLAAFVCFLGLRAFRLFCFGCKRIGLLR